ncbi:hypothetical protein N0V90_002313 [Kalmusia sp. IMI 367209]|nr:hypothetical protein N0V90_002313 [Kalmusia sp. IMI 367209]
MSDSETDVPSAATISRAIRDTVISIHKSGKDEDLTVKRVRARAEQTLGLTNGFLKNDDWKDKSKDLILKAVDQYCGDEPEPTPSPKKVSKAKPKPKVRPEPKQKTKPAASATRGVKRKAPAPAKKPQKRRKTTTSDEESDAVPSNSLIEDDEPSDDESELPKQPIRRQKKVVAEDSDEDDATPKKPISKVEDKGAESNGDAQAGSPVEGFERPATPPPAVKDDVSESELSSVIDESPAKNKRRKKKLDEKRAKEPKSTKAKPKVAKDKKPADDPDTAEIKRLQGWLVKCGIRKVWGKELANCDTPKDKIRHLKGMLKDAGMDGKYSVEKAAKIKEQREFAKDLEDIQAGAVAWGDAETSNTGRPRRRAAQPVRPIVQVDDEEDSNEEKDQTAKDDETDEDEDDEVKGDSESDNNEDEVEEDEDEDSD